MAQVHSGCSETRAVQLAVTHFLLPFVLVLRGAYNAGTYLRKASGRYF